MPEIRSSAEELRHIFKSRITVDAIVSDLESCPIKATCDKVHGRLSRKGFDVAGVRDGDRIVGYVVRDELDGGTVGEHLSHFRPGDLVSDSTPLIETIGLLDGRDALFVLDGDQVRGVVTPADLQKTPVRMLLFGLISLLEMQLTRLIRQHYETESWQESLSEGRRQNAEKILEERRKRNEELTLLDCIQFGDKKDLIADVQVYRDKLGLGSKKAARETLKNVRRLRDDLAHSQDILGGRSATEIIEAVDTIRDLVARCESI